MPSPSAYYCAKAIDELLSDHRNRKRSTMSHNYFREVTGRAKITDAFVFELNKVSLEHFAFHVARISKTEFIIVRTSSRFFDEDPAGAPDDDL